MTNDDIVTDDKIREALRFLLRPRAERVTLAEAAVGLPHAKRPVWLNDDVVGEAHRRGFLQVVESYQPGDLCVAGEHGRIHGVVLTIAGRMFVDRG